MTLRVHPATVAFTLLIAALLTYVAWDQFSGPNYAQWESADRYAVRLMDDLDATLDECPQMAHDAMSEAAESVTYACLHAPLQGGPAQRLTALRLADWDDLEAVTQDTAADGAYSIRTYRTDAGQALVIMAGPHLTGFGATIAVSAARPPRGAR